MMLGEKLSEYEEGYQDGKQIGYTRGLESRPGRTQKRRGF